MSELAQRIRDDEACGDLGMAKRRLASYLRTKGFDSEILARIGPVCYAMRDPAEAGRYWLLSGASGPEVDVATELFVQRVGRVPAQVVSQLPRKLRLRTLGEYPAAAQARLVRLGLADAVVLPVPDVGAATKVWRRKGMERVTIWGCGIIAALLGGLVGLALVLGFIQIVRMISQLFKTL